MGGKTKPRKHSDCTADRPGSSEEVFDVSGAAAFTGETDKAIRARVARRSIPFRRWGGRIVFLRSELSEFLQALEGCKVQEALANATPLDARAEVTGNQGERKRPG
jgi:hypothetical protein